MLSAVMFALFVCPAYAGKKPDSPHVAPAAPSPVVIDPAFEADIRRLLQASGAGAMGTQMMDQMIVSLQPMSPSLPPEFWSSMRTEANADGLVTLVVPIYAKHLTRDEVLVLIAFYESPVGSKLVAVQPAMMAESMQVGQVWGQEIAARIVAKMQAQPQ